ncbi:MAG TPA: TlpA disulfide reductase family protein [Anaerolineae bacterium]|nr:TlpA disulfide reductase family protein [Anaerolineae bacterium]
MSAFVRVLSIGLALLSVACAPATSLFDETLTSIQLGSIAPAFTLKTLAGGQASLSDYQGRPMFLNFWASWCGPCREEMPEIIEAYQAYKDAGLQVLAIDNTQLDVVDDVQAFVDEFQMPFPVLLDAEGAVAAAYSVLGLPTSVFIDANGIVQGVNVGPLTGDELETYIGDILPAK